jgi:single-stranded DNA-binding protein
MLNLFLEARIDDRIRFEATGSEPRLCIRLLAGTSHKLKGPPVIMPGNKPRNTYPIHPLLRDRLGWSPEDKKGKFIVTKLEDATCLVHGAYRCPTREGREKETNMNRVFIVGNITGNIFFEVVNNKPYLRLLLMAGKPRRITGLRIVLTGDNARKFFPYLKKGSEIGVIGLLTTREHRGKWITEVDATHLILLRNINWENGEAKREDLLPSMSSSFLVGTIEEAPYFEWRSNGREGQAAPDDSERYAYLHLSVGNGDRLRGLGISVYGTLAQIARPYLQAGSVVAIDGHFQTRGKEGGPRTIEATAEHIAFLDNINWEAGAAAQRRMVEQEAAAESPPGLSADDTSIFQQSYASS